MSNLSARGTKRICQSEACALPFYDLNRTDFACPNCGTVFDTTVVLHPRRAPTTTPAWKRSRAFPIAAAAPAAEPKELEDVVVEADGDDADEADAGTLILEEEEDDGDMGDVVKAPADDRGDV